MNKNDFDISINILNSLNNEEDIIKQITYIIRKFYPHMYSNQILSNPYYKDIFIEIKEEVINDLLDLKDSINNEISSISNDMINHSEIDELGKLRDYCKSLLHEVDRKILEIKSLV